MGSLQQVLPATGLFLVTNIDDIIILSLFFARGAGTSRVTARITVGQYLGFGAILAASLAVTASARTYLPESAIAYFGFVPLALGLRAAWAAWRERDHEDNDDERVGDRGVSVLSVAAVTFANGGDNIGVYVPVFATVRPSTIATYVVVFLLLVAVLVAAARFVATRKAVAPVLERSERVLFPLVLIVLGVVILLEGGAFGL